MDCLRMLVVTPLYPAVIRQQADLSRRKLVLISPYPSPVQPQYMVFEICTPHNDTTRWLEPTHYAGKICTLDVPFFSPDGKVIHEKRLICTSTVRPMGRVLWNQYYRRLKLVMRRSYFPTLAAYRGLAGRFPNLIRQPILLDTDTYMATSSEDALRFPNLIRQPILLDTDTYMATSSEDALLSSSTTECWAYMVDAEVPHVEMLEPQAIKVEDDIPNSSLLLSTVTPEHDLAYLLPADPFGMGFT